VLLGVFLGSAMHAACATTQIPIPRIEQMPNMPRPYAMRDWRKVARDFDALAFDFGRRGEHLPLIKRDKGPGVGEKEVFAINSFVGWGRHRYETITCMGAVNGASVAGIDKSDQNGADWVKLCANFFDDRPGISLYLNNPNDRTGGSFWYELFPNILFYRIFSRYPDTPGMAQQFTLVADRWFDACVGMGGRLAPWVVPDFNHTSYDFRSGKPVDNGQWREGGSSGAIAWLEYMAYVRSGNKKYLSATRWGLDYLQAAAKSPYYEVLLPHGAYVAARMNAEQGTRYDAEKLVHWCFDGSGRRRWGESTGRWGAYDFSGIACSLWGHKDGSYAFAMNTFNKANSLVPLVRYDARFARAIGKWMLNAANSMRLFYANGLPPDHQTDYAWATKHDPNACLAYEGLRRVQSTNVRLQANHLTRYGKVKHGPLRHTQSTDKRYQVLEETRVADRDRLEHIWMTTLPEADSHQLHMSAKVSGSEAFVISYAANAEGPFTQVCVFDSRNPRGRGGKLSLSSGPLYLKVADADPDVGNDALDSLSVDDVWIASTANKSPYATGDAKANGWAKTNFGLYGSSFVGIFGGIIRTTNVEGILQLDCLATDYFHAPAYPTYLYFNPHTEQREVEIDVGAEPKDLYNGVTGAFLKRDARGKTAFAIAGDNAVLLVVAPAGGTFQRDGPKTLINDVVVDYRRRG